MPLPSSKTVVVHSTSSTPAAESAITGACSGEPNQTRLQTPVTATLTPEVTDTTYGVGRLVRCKVLGRGL